VNITFTRVADGDLGIQQPDPAALAAARARLSPLPWTWLRQVHGAEVVTVTAPGEGAGREADAAVTAVPGALLAIQTADCAPIALTSPQGVIGAVHAGWRGLEAGVVEAAVDAMRALGATEVRASLGPCIHAECYEFGADDLDRLAKQFGDEVRSTTPDGTPALDLPAAVDAALVAAGVKDRGEVLSCTACDTDYFSHRARGDTGRQALLVWM
jgi:YfiH family protein